jgi:hypothetical protein
LDRGPPGTNAPVTSTLRHTRCQAVLLPHLPLGYFVALNGRLWLGGVVSGLAWVVATIAVMPISAQGPVAALFRPVIGLPLPLAARGRPWRGQEMIRRRIRGPC